MTDRIEAIWQRTRALRPLIEAHRDEAESLHHLPDAVGKAYIANNVFRLLMPTEYGGEDVDLLTYYDLVEEVASYDGSAGWNFSIGSSTPIILADLLPSKLRMIFATADACIAASTTPLGRAEETDGGYRLTGRFAWASGIHQAHWVLALGAIFDGETMRKSPAGTPVVLGFLMPKESCTVLDTWHVLGMRGTGSTEFEADHVFVPKEMAIRIFQGKSRYPHPVFRLPPTYFGYNHVSVMNGIARSAVAALKSLATKKTSPLGSMRDDPQAQYAVAKAEALVEANRLSVKHAFGRIWEKVLANQPVSIEARAGLRRAIANAAEGAIEAVNLCYRAAGGTAMYESTPFARALRDINSAATHMAVRRVMMEDAGRVTFGLRPRTSAF
ncbi:MAG TPA: acyl-CoA dehydrogenase family protein [Candidatus Binataceae bacterium]|nr:acyl-CoA dehydrogenase family protein [Candidatus Binataceae bacterium]